jgi:predicted AAA+ superfamily ATPase
LRFELLRRGYKVDIGKVGDTEVDFVARNVNEVVYFQVTWTVNTPEAMKREYRPFDAIDDHCEKVILTMDKDFVNSVNGVRKVNVIDFLLDETRWPSK